MPILPHQRTHHVAPPLDPSALPDPPASPLPEPDPFAAWDRFFACLPHMQDKLHHMDEDLHRMIPQPDWGQVISLSTGNPVRIERAGRQYYRLLVGAATSVVFDTPTGAITLNLTAGWNVINLPEGTSMTLQSGSAVNVYALASDHING